MWIFLASLYISPALADTPCTQPLTRLDWESALNAGDRYLDEGDYLNASRLLTWTQDHTHCLSTLVTPEELGRFALQAMFMASLEEDTALVEEWASLTKVLPHEVPSWLPETHQASSIYQDTKATKPRHRKRFSLNVPSGGAIFLNGSHIIEPVAPQNTPNLIQVAERKGVVVQSQWQHGAHFDRDILTAPGEAAKAPRWLEKGDTPPAAKGSPLLAHAASFGVASVALYGTSWASRGMYEQGDYGQLSYQMTNGSLIAAAVCAGVSAGLAGASLTRGR